MMGEKKKASVEFFFHFDVRKMCLGSICLFLFFSGSKTCLGEFEAQSSVSYFLQISYSTRELSVSLPVFLFLLEQLH